MNRTSEVTLTIRLYCFIKKLCFICTIIVIKVKRMIYYQFITGNYCFINMEICGDFSIFTAEFISRSKLGQR